jgi:hypothetical protein
MSQTDFNIEQIETIGVIGCKERRMQKFHSKNASRLQAGTLALLEKQKEKVLIFLTAAVILSFCLAPAALASAVVTAAGDPGRTPSNPFDYSNLTVTSNSPTYNAQSDVRDIFGGSFSTLEAPGRTIFADHPGQPTTYDVFFTLNSPIALAGYSLFLGEDGGSLNRSATNFELLANGKVVSNVALAAQGSDYAVRFGSDSIQVSDTFAPVSASTFEAIFTSNIGFNNGIRVLGFQAQAGTIFQPSSQAISPEPSSISLALLAGVAFVAFFRRRVAR